MRRRQPVAVVHRSGVPRPGLAAGNPQRLGAIARTARSTLAGRDGGGVMAGAGLEINKQF